ncbi:3'(2'),5'-bisphosphate nucleotidase CysQ [Hyphobacterium sp. HN65]|uniref:3'(2'),5'-bisphosphate nucleotidase CysQ n=1 Tax=Hyphobacterium lacteum TaxID=3116575 RepID=A0ABU7LPN8_9PROT|nr:3'(2'),5'-bisphosphate nucleotidase CysQ [Hyphobacterium sp. HN65]MEE2525881.1 3'(2'),5'-bisphosphate nucleotidase CysQ [Hyphobacterium sp. HN65]
MIDISSEFALTYDKNNLALEFAQICSRAAIPVMEVYATDFTPEQKADRSPVTQADTLAEKIMLDALQSTHPNIPIIAEEQFSTGVRPDVGDEFLLVDPVDGTKEFIAKNGEFTLNIALIRGGHPVVGCVFAPAMERIYLGGEGAFAGPLIPGCILNPAALVPIATRKTPPPSGPVAIISRSHADDQTQAFIEAQGVVEKFYAGSSLKFCRLAEGVADIYPRFAPTMEWDTGAGHAVLNGAGGAVTKPDGTQFRYGKSENDYRNGHFIAWAAPPG